MFTRFTTDICNVYEAASVESKTSSQGLYGEGVEVLEHSGHWLKISQLRDGYIAYVEAERLGSSPIENTHWVSARATPLFSAPDIKSPVMQTLQYGSELHLLQTEHGNFYTTDEQKGFVWCAHVRKLGNYLNSSVLKEARNAFSNTPYLWGGRSPAGVDCSGLVQSCAFALGYNLPRDSHQQEAFLSHTVEYGQQRANDLIFWPGHVAIAVDNTHVFHATAHTLDTRQEALHSVEQRAGKPSSIKRLHCSSTSQQPQELN